MKLCRTCRYGRMYEMDKPCVVYRDDCPLYEGSENMANEKAIEELKAIKSEYSNNLFGDAKLMKSEQDALDMAIKALEQEPKWIPVSERLPELNKPLLVTAYHRVCYAHMISESGNYGYPVFRLHEIKDSDRAWVQETISHEPYSKGRIDAWMYIDIPEPYKAESDHKCHTCKHYLSGEYDGSCDSYICEHYSDWESDNCN